MYQLLLGYLSFCKPANPSQLPRIPQFLPFFSFTSPVWRTSNFDSELSKCHLHYPAFLRTLVSVNSPFILPQFFASIGSVYIVNICITATSLWNS